ncbi:phage tail protein [Poseidonocella sp. HB161398]|uniref:phage tail protein n=1 Tax=Poseidonocella sp. HB161398 TaxID=2320855 RepID=UPI001109869E|nr:phage tail protein [Poseidonocella sp. HB161398]
MTAGLPPIPLQVFNFTVTFRQVDAEGKPKAGAVALCSGRFSEVSGIEATMEPKAIREGGRNYGDIQRAGRVTFSTVILKRGVTRSPDLWTWFQLVGQGKTATRLQAELIHSDWPDPPAPPASGASFPQPERPEVMRWTMTNALPVKFKAAAYSASASEVGIEELHFVHEGLSLAVGGRTV